MVIKKNRLLVLLYSSNKFTSNDLWTQQSLTDNYWTRGHVISFLCSSKLSASWSVFRILHGSAFIHPLLHRHKFRQRSSWIRWGKPRDLCEVGMIFSFVTALPAIQLGTIIVPKGSCFLEKYKSSLTLQKKQNLLNAISCPSLSLTFRWGLHLPLFAAATVHLYNLIFALFPLYTRLLQGGLSKVHQRISSVKFHGMFSYYSDMYHSWNPCIKPRNGEYRAAYQSVVPSWDIPQKKRRIYPLPSHENNRPVSCFSVALGKPLSMLSKPVNRSHPDWPPFWQVSVLDETKQETASNNTHPHHDMSYQSNWTLCIRNQSTADCIPPASFILSSTASPGQWLRRQ